MLSKLTAKLKGVTPLCVHNVQLADPLFEGTREIKKISGKRNKTEEDHMELARLEWLYSLYVDADGRYILPGKGIEAALRDTAKRKKLGKKFNASLMAEDAVIIFPKQSVPPEDLWEDENYRLRTAHRVTTSRVMRTTPIFRDWSLTVELSYLASELDEDVIQAVLKDCGELNGWFELRPRYGRFSVVA